MDCERLCSYPEKKKKIQKILGPSTDQRKAYGWTISQVVLEFKKYPNKLFNYFLMSEGSFEKLLKLVYSFTFLSYSAGCDLIASINNSVSTDMIQGDCN